MRLLVCNSQWVTSRIGHLAGRARPVDPVDPVEIGTGGIEAYAEVADMARDQVWLVRADMTDGDIGLALHRISDSAAPAASFPANR